MLKEILENRNLLPILKFEDGREVTKENFDERREEMIAILEKHSYGHTPKCAFKVSAEITSSDPNSYAGKALEDKVNITVEIESGSHTFPIQIFVPHKVNKPPVLLHIAFSQPPHRYVPVEEITDRGYALVVVDYRDMVNDRLRGDYTDGIAKLFGTTIDREPEEWGKIGMWAWGASRVMDYLVAEREDLDTGRVAVIGHSRLGKTALWCGAQDKRFAAVISNNSGYGGAATSKHGEGERVRDFLRCGSWDWYCERFKDYTDEKEDEKPYDQSFLLALIAPRILIVGSAKEDKGADPKSEFLTELHAASAWELLGEKGLITPDKMPETGARLDEGNVCYHYREGRHFLSREDWNAYIDILNKKF